MKSMASADVESNIHAYSYNKSRWSANMCPVPCSRDRDHMIWSSLALDRRIHINRVFRRHLHSLCWHSHKG